MAPPPRFELGKIGVETQSASIARGNLVLPDGIEPPSPVLQTGANPSQLEKLNLAEDGGHDPQSLSGYLVFKTSRRPSACFIFLNLDPLTGLEPA